MASIKEIAVLVIDFNEKFKVGDSVQVKTPNGEIISAPIRFDAELTENNIPIVWIHGYYDAFKLEDIIIRKE